MTQAQTYSFFLGCVMPNRFPNVEKSIRVVLPKLGIDIEDLQGASCCPAPGVIRSFSEPTWLALASRNLALAEAAGHDILTGCNGCYGTFKEALHVVHENPERLKEVQRILKSVGVKYEAKADAKHLVEIIYNLGLENLRKKVTRPLNGLRVGTHYGCHLLKPTKLRPWKQTQKYTFLDELVEVTGAESVKYKEKFLCCGAGGGVRGSNVPVSIDIAREKLDNMIEAGAECIVDVCSFCHLQFEMSQPQLNKEIGDRYHLPVFYYTQLLGLAMGIDPEELGLHKHVISTDALVDRFL
ncbi:MAG: CoB--CoM heterodisulfide reductase subunit B [Candidatus Thorarchaeota archaeon]|nr:MAG: CoB--CoM heterodisulfide reductase subunit B [Candidatus Thorarchaeota archaeon]